MVWTFWGTKSSFRSIKLGDSYATISLFLKQKYRWVWVEAKNNHGNTVTTWKLLNWRLDMIFLAMYLGKFKWF